MNQKLSVLAATLLVALPLFAQPATDKPVVAPGAKAAEPKKARAKTDKKVVGAPGIAFVRVLHAMPGGQAVDVYAGSTKIGSNLKFKGFSEYTEIKSGKSAFKVVATGKTDPPVVTDSATATKGKFYTIAVYGKQAASLLLINESTGKADPTKARVRVVHLSPGAPAVTITAPSTQKAKLGYAKFVTKPLEYGKTASKLAKPATLKLQIRTADGKLVKETADVKLEAGKRYSVFAVGEVAATGAGSFDVLVESAGR